MGQVDPSFIQAVEHRPKLTVIEAQGIPIIDLSTSNIDTLVAEIGGACESWGFFQVGLWLIKSYANLCFLLYFYLTQPNKIRRNKKNKFTNTY